MQTVMPLYPFLINSQRIVPFEDPLFFIHIPLIKGVSTLTVNFDLSLPWFPQRPDFNSCSISSSNSVSSLITDILVSLLPLLCTDFGKKKSHRDEEPMFFQMCDIQTAVSFYSLTSSPALLFLWLSAASFLLRNKSFLCHYLILAFFF